MAETPETDKLVKAEPEAPQHDPIISRSTSGILLVCALLLTGSLVWALWDEVYAMRPWKSYQQSFAKRYERYLNRIEKRGFKTEKEVREGDEFKRLQAEAEAARRNVKPQVDRINGRVKIIDSQLAAITDEFQNRRGHITVANYEVEHSDEDEKAGKRREVEELKSEKAEIEMPRDDGSGKTDELKLNFTEIEERYNRLKDEKGRLLAESGELLKPASELEKKRDEYLKDNVTEVTEQQVRLLKGKVDNFDFGLRQINVTSGDIVDRCETCHLGAREPIRITPTDMMPAGRNRRPDALARAFASHPSKELLQVHDPEKFGCASCHWGNGRATTTLEKGHGRNKYWLYPLFARENMEAGCNQCHAGDRVLQGAPTLTKGKDLFYERGCVGCHRYEGFDRESDALSSTRQLIKQLEDERTANERDARAARAESATAASDEVAQSLLARAENLVVTNSQLEARMAQLETQSRYLMQDQKKVGPNLKDVRLKLRKEWIPEWLKDPQAFRPGTKMPTFWYLSGEKNHLVPSAQQDDERKAIAAYLWQTAYEGRMPTQPRGDAAKGEELFKTKGCLACHSIGEGEQKVGGEFAANLTRLGQKANYDYIVKWVHNPRDRWAPYCPKEKRDLSPEDYRKHGKPFVFDTHANSKCPNDGSELQVQNMTVMPNFRLTDQDARDVATYLVSLNPEASYPEASYMDDPKLKEQGHALIKIYGCAGCHEIRGFEEEQRIGKELTTEGATPLERLDFATMTHRAELGLDPYDPEEKKPYLRTGSDGNQAANTKKKGEVWYNHKGFIENKINDPAVYDLGKEKDPREHLRMPKPYLTPEWKKALTTFLLGSVGTEGSNVPRTLFYQPTDQQKAIQDGWWVVKKYNCMGCHSVQVGQRSVLSSLPLYQTPETKDQVPPGLTTEGARVDPEWLLRFLTDPSLSGSAEGIDVHGAQKSKTTAARAQTPRLELPGSSQVPPGGATNGAQGGPQSAQGGDAQMGTLKGQPGENRNGVRRYLKVRMPTFNFSPNELRTLVRFFLAVSAQQEPYIKESLEPLTPDEQNLARALFTSQAAPCLKCHMTGDAGHDQTATAPNFLDSSERLKADWTFRWLLDPQRIMPGTAMPSELFKRDGERWIFNGPLPPQAADYQGDHARLLVRYLLQLTPEEQARTSRSQPAPSGSQPNPVTTAPAPVASGGNKARRNTAVLKAKRRGTQSASRDARGYGRRQQVSARGRRGRDLRAEQGARARARRRELAAALAARRDSRDFSR